MDQTPSEYLTNYLQQPFTAHVDGRTIHKHTGRAEHLCRADVAIKPPQISKAKHRYHERNISLELAIRLERASGGELDAAKLAPQHADLISYLRGSRVPE